jgi:hypothetical protein
VACSALNGFTHATGAVRGAGSELVGVGTGAPLQASLLDPACAGAPAPAGPPAGDPDEVAAATDAEGTVVAAASSEDATIVTALDEVAPAITAVHVPASARTGEPVDVSVDGGDSWGLAAIAWSVDGAAAGTGRALRLPAQRAGRHQVAVAMTDVAGNVARETRTLEVSEDAAPAPPPQTPVAPPVVVPVPPAGGGGAPAVRPRVLSAKVQRRRGVWFVSLRLRGADRVQLSLLRAPYLSAERLRELGRDSGCGPHGGHRPTGRKGRMVQRISGERVRVRLPAAMQRALRARGRYVLRVVALGADGQRSKPATTRRWTVCG